MKRVNEYKKLFCVEGAIELAPLKKKYRSLVKEWHPDKFQEGDEKAAEAEEMGRKVVDGYHFLVSIAPETKEANKEDYTRLTTQSAIYDFKHKSQLLEITFVDGTTYEYFGVNRNLYMKFANSDKPYRFAKRSIFNSFTYRQSKKAQMQEA